VFLVNAGHDNLEVTVRMPPDTAHLPLTVTFPEGTLIGLAKERLPVDISCCSSRPLSFTTTLDFLNKNGEAFSLAVTAATDSCSLSHVPFMRVGVGEVHLAGAVITLLHARGAKMVCVSV
jgi:hypothetical protein